MKVSLAISLILLAAFGFSPVLASATTITPMQTQPPCPTYQTNIEIAFVDSNPHTAPVGTMIVTIFQVIYPDGTPVTNLSPSAISVKWTGPSGEKQLDNQPVTPVDGKPGYYNYTAPLANEIVQAVGQGQLTLSIVTCSCSDGFGNRGPTGVVSSIETIVQNDDSRVAIELIQPAPESLTSTLFPFIILALLILALLALVLRRRGKKPSS